MEIARQTNETYDFFYGYCQKCGKTTVDSNDADEKRIKCCSRRYLCVSL